MSKSSIEKTKRRRYNSPIRRQQTAETQERIVSAGVELVHQLPAWDWTNLTVRAVGEHASINERTVYRYFPTERKLRDAVIQRLLQESGVFLHELKLNDFAEITTIMFSYLQSFSAQPITSPTEDTTLATMDQIRCDALRNAVNQATTGWTDRERENAAAALDIFWNLPPFERLIQGWGFEAERAISLMAWIIDLVNDAIIANQKPTSTL